jgi:hypothetical protein
MTPDPLPHAHDSTVLTLFPTTFSLNHYLLLMCSRHLPKYFPDNVQPTHIGKTSIFPIPPVNRNDRSSSHTSILNITINPAQTLTRSPTGAVGRDPIRLMLHATISSTRALQSLLPDHSVPLARTSPISHLLTERRSLSPSQQTLSHIFWLISVLACNKASQIFSR